ncbi:DUF3575 domain-containing protein [uncultured Sanguibacteroides sp.]|uniref:DUF3575 domain-containing protein n=1 Tax=uncultured Sanguibacteroides sp. TaxID=1635151 RepID=UPI0028050EA4|nr:DUF3575 domain-containing protein [uncultured Sanguibacteroides sp.]
MKKHLTFLILLLLTGTTGYSRSAAPDADAKIVTFRFQPGKDMFALKGNETELTRLYSLVDEYRDQITAGELPLYVDGYCALRTSERANRHTAYIRASRVKSELIVNKGLKEADFVTANYATDYNGNKDVVVVTLRIPVKKETPVVKEEPKPEPKPEPQPVAEEQPAPAPEPEPVAQIVPAAPAPVRPYPVSICTNVLYDAMLLPTLGVEWRINPDLGVKLDGSLAWWGGEHDKTMKVWLLNPEVRWYLLRDRRFYVGVSGSYGKYNLYKYPLGSLFSKDTGYQGALWSAGLTVGYQLYLSRSFSVDFNLGLGYTQSDYDSFWMIDGVRVYKDRDKSKSFFGPTQVGINLIWTIGGHK